MQYELTPGENAFRDEVRAFVSTALPPETRQAMIAGRNLPREAYVAWQRALDSRGWGVPGWPAEWGGTDWTPVQRFIFQREIQRAGAPTMFYFGTNLVGPVLIRFGNDRQKERFLPAIRTLDEWWCQGFSEPGSGSDLASVRLTARRDGDVYLLNGQKMWTTYAQWADWMFCVARTDSAAKPQQGISFILVDMRSPGIRVRPVYLIDGYHEVNEVFFDDVRVPAENLVGEENRGWDYAKFLLSNERMVGARIGMLEERIRRIRECAAKVEHHGAPLSENLRFGAKVAELEVETRALEMTVLRILSSERANDGTPDPASSFLKVKGTGLLQRATELLLEAAGPAAVPALPGDGLEWAETTAPNYFNWRKLSIAGGTSEIQYNIIAKATLGL